MNLKKFTTKKELEIILNVPIGKKHAQFKLMRKYIEGMFYKQQRR